MEQNEFFVSREPASHQGPENIHFLTNLKRTLSIDEAKRLRDKLTELLGDAPKPEVAKPSAADLDVVAEEAEVKEQTSGEPEQWPKKKKWK